MRIQRTFMTALVIALATSVVLSGCERDAGQSKKNFPVAEEAHISSKVFDNYELHFNAMSTNQLQPEIARVYNIARSKNRALLTVSILKSNGKLTGTPVSGTVVVKAANLTGQIKNMKLRQVQDGDAVYYIGDTSVANGETLIFDIEAMPVDETQKLSVRFSRQFFSN
jgi:hypothetical protein